MRRSGVYSVTHRAHRATHQAVLTTRKRVSCLPRLRDDPRGWLAPVEVPPTEFTDHMEDLENWANTNNKEAVADLIEYWALKLPVIVAAVSSAVLAYFKLDNLAVVAAAGAAACLLIDGLNPRGALRNVHQRAYNDISTLHANMAAQWRTASLRREDTEQLAAEIIEGSEAERNRIRAYLTALTPRTTEHGAL